MKIDVKEATVTTNIPQENVTAMSISVDGMEHIMTLLTNLYKDPELAVIREYYTNALDAHVAASVKDEKVIVTLPTWDSPVYKVQDFGIGMSEADIKNIYAQYGASTKRNTNDQVGAFGLGCKSALTIATQFTVVSIKDGRKTTALISKTESGVNTINIVNTTDTTDGNGTTVKIPVPDRYSFNRKAGTFFQFSTPGLVSVDGMEPSSVLDSATHIFDPAVPTNEVYIKTGGYGSSFLIMGNVGYELSQDEVDASLTRLKRTANRSFSTMPKYFPVPIGSVDLTPSREGLRFTDKTNALIDARITFLLDDLVAIAQREIDTITDLPEYFEAQKKWRDILPEDKRNIWNGETVPHYKEFKDMRIIERSSYNGSNHSMTNRFHYNAHHEAFLVKGFSAVQYNKINPYITGFMTAEGKSSAKFIITDDDTLYTDKWVAKMSNVTIIDASVIIDKGKAQRKKERAEAAKNGSTPVKKTMQYPVLHVDDHKIVWTDSDKIPANSPYLSRGDLETSNGLDDHIRNVYYNGADRTVSEKIAPFVQALTKAKTIILLGGGRTKDAMLKRVPTTYSLLNDAVKAKADAEVLLTDDVITHYSVKKSAWSNFLNNAGLLGRINEIKDEKVREVITPAPAVQKSYETVESVVQSLEWMSFRTITPLKPKVSSSRDNTAPLTKKYPLVNAITTWQLNDKARAHIVTYLNAIHDETVAATTLPVIPAVPVDNSVKV